MRVANVGVGEQGQERHSGAGLDRELEHEPSLVALPAGTRPPGGRGCPSPPSSSILS